MEKLDIYRLKQFTGAIPGPSCKVLSICNCFIKADSNKRSNTGRWGEMAAIVGHELLLLWGEKKASSSLEPHIGMR